ncbi:helix-turn-helix domain-containing protein [Dactylosporangium sp. CA-092794]|uniref:helix-turn-helix domain-containing protein n=1 Tax=Dactylosporangium sp. CA-092794 TaxID=3239929 RepID=UPI003D8AC5A2
MTRRAVVAAKLGMSEPTLHRIETGKVPVSPANVRALCWLYGIESTVTDALAELALGTTRGDWWDASPAVPDWLKMYVELEAGASGIAIYSDEIVPGELQTEGYARALLAGVGAVDVEAVKLRVRRQKALLGRVPAVPIVAVLGESAVRRLVGGEGVLAEQVEFLRQLARLEHVRIKVLPFAAGAHAGMAGAFRILDFDDPDDPDVVYLESYLGAVYLEAPAEVAEYRRVFALIEREAVPLEDYRR